MSGDTYSPTINDGDYYMVEKDVDVKGLKLALIETSDKKTYLMKLNDEENSTQNTKIIGKPIYIFWSKEISNIGNIVE